MVLTDTLQQTVNEINRCMAAYPECYGPMRRELEALCERIDNVRDAMDQHAHVSGQEAMLRAAARAGKS